MKNLYDAEHMLAWNIYCALGIVSFLAVETFNFRWRKFNRRVANNRSSLVMHNFTAKNLNSQCSFLVDHDIIQSSLNSVV